MKKTSRSRSTSNSSIKKSRKKSFSKTMERKPRSEEEYRHSTYASINSRVGKGSYKKIKNLFDLHSWNKWFNENLPDLRKLIEDGKIPSIERVDSHGNYEPQNCIWLPNKLNQALGRVHYYEKMADSARSYCSKHLEDIPENLRDYYRTLYDI